ncbi:hypothetical protein K443DRAFT_673988 [Laccaria amethystina LaAM-08-1]|uniref:JmjC domain-containing protein n=1 Tax=Laccaria amethystina LaAM-08-1 TaxID=1095629 RepID=A0A0C9XYE9_9AGAR|nr:hypothetical protein K443DRAFT_673988 [Laccaria amethystina LaAM-08-1]
MGERLVSVATTPDGRADALSRGPDDKFYFVEPFVEKMTIGDLIKHLKESEGVDGEVRYLQSQNGNLFPSDFFGRSSDDANSPSEFEPLRSDVPSEIPWCTEALGKRPDAVNIWIGNSRSTTSIHSDPYENIYAVVRGEKNFLLIPPTDGWCLQERSYPHASYTRRSPSSSLELVPSGPDVPLVPWASVIDPELPSVLPSDVTPIYVTLKPGEVLYLPVGWWHHVRQVGDITISLNWWYDAEMRGMSWVFLSFLRGLGHVPVAPSMALGEHCSSESV